MFAEIPELTAVLRDPLHATRTSERPLVVFMSNNVPVELIHAAGCFPLQWPTAPLTATPRADEYMEGRFDPMARSAFEQLLRGELASARLLVLPRTIDSLQRLYYYVCELRRSFGESLPEPFLYDLLHTPFETSAAHNLESTRVLAERLEALTGLAVNDALLSASIARYDRVRTKLASLNARRRAEPAQLTGEHALELYTAAQRMLPEAFEPILDRLLASRSEAAPGTRVLLIGSAHDTTALHRSVANAGGQVVGDFHWRGDLLLGPVIDSASAQPLSALSKHYHRSWSCRTYPVPIALLIEHARASHAEAAVFFYYGEEEALTWDFSAQRDALAELGVPSLALEVQPYPPTTQVEPHIQDFLAQASRLRASSRSES
jgi:benzoyl-CoA reductase/2-hydroxyglutaryl-CoA dehydratase subunit BcrC/BadD/HgdB